MRVLLSTYGGRGDVEPLVALAVRLRESGAEVRVSAPPDWAERFARFDLELTPLGASVRDLLHAKTAPSVADVPRMAAELMADQFAKLPAVAQGCDTVVATGLFPVAASVQSVAEKLGARYVYAAYCPVFLPSPQRRPMPAPGKPLPADVTDPGELDAISIRNYNEVFGEALNANRASLGLPPVDNARDQVFTDHPWVAADPVLAPADPGLTQPGAWTLPDERPLPAALEAFLDQGTPPVYVGFGSMRAPADIARIAVDAIRAQGRRAVFGGGWAGLAPIEEWDGCFAVDEVNQQALFRRVAVAVHHGGAGTTTAAAAAGVPQVVVPQMADQPYFAARVAELGIGVAHDGATPTTESLSAALERALTADTRTRAAAVAPTIRTDGATVTARLLVEGHGHES
ncbi:glycosyltransferase [Asanoa sp. NPDC049573]|uniref:glycosyltransferase n=1 Tax=Asanoa sp. NPDC049573 TaxID=3155396 RepID=UPI00342BC648